jgi:hypothetical protein
MDVLFSNRSLKWGCKEVSWGDRVSSVQGGSEEKGQKKRGFWKGAAVQTGFESGGRRISTVRSRYQETSSKDDTGWNRFSVCCSDVWSVEVSCGASISVIMSGVLEGQQIQYPIQNLVESPTHCVIVWVQLFGFRKRSSDYRISWMRQWIFSILLQHHISKLWSRIAYFLDIPNSDLWPLRLLFKIIQIRISTYRKPDRIRTGLSCLPHRH